MTFEDVLALSKAGFTADEIRRMSENLRVTKDTPVKNTVNKVENEVKPENTFDAIAAYNALSKDIASLTRLVQEFNMLNAQNPAPRKDSVDDILASIVKPTFRKEDK